MNLKSKITLLADILLKYSELYSQLDENVLRGDSISHKWIDQLISLSTEDKKAFDADRNSNILKDKEWRDLISLKKELCSFEKVENKDSLDHLLGNKKKRHELTQLKSLLKKESAHKIVDFGGGVGNLGHFLHTELKKNVHVLEKDPKLISKGILKLKDYKDKISFEHTQIEKNSKLDLSPYQLGIGLHTCGNFATDIFRACIQNKLPKIVNFGCCYSKIKDHDYNLSQDSHKDIVFNARALSYATLGFQSIPHDFFDFRQKIIHYKLSFYHWLYEKHGKIEFQSMSNSRRNLFDKSPHEFFIITLNKFFPEFQEPTKTEVEHFYNSQKNKDFLDYLWAYYAIARYFGELIETYIIVDRALFLQDNGYKVEIKEVFDPSISPRNKVILAEL